LVRHLGRIFLNDRRADVFTKVHPFIEGEPSADRVFNAPLRNLLAVHTERPGATLSNSATVVLEIKTDGVLTRSELLRRRNPVLVLILVREGIRDPGLPVGHQKRPPAEASANCSEDTASTA